MFKFIARLAIRTLVRFRLFTILNITGLSLGYLVFFIIMFYVSHQISFDRFHEKSAQIYRLTSATKERVAAIVPYTWGHQMRNEIAAIENVASFQNITIALTVKQGNDVFAQHGFLGVDSTFLDIFDFKLLSGSKKEFLSKPDKMLITADVAKKYFGAENPIGKSLQVNLWGTFVTYEVSGVVECPDNSHIQFKFLIPIQWVKKYFFSQTAFTSWSTHFCHTYFVMASGFDQVRLKLEMKDFLERHGGKSLRDKFTPNIQPLSDIYLKSDIQFDFQPRGDYQHVLILLAVAFGVVVMALINFVNISTARSIRAVKETGIRKIMGEGKRQIFGQFLIESLLVSLISGFLAIGCSILILPYFNILAETNFDWGDIITPTNMVWILCLTILVATLGTIYPASLMSSFKPATVLNTRTGNQLKSGIMRKILVIIQFTLAVILLISTGVIFQQVNYMNNKHLGFTIDHVIVLNGARVVAADKKKMQLLKDELSKFDGIESITACSSYPGDAESHWSSRYLPEGWPEDESVSLWSIYTDHDFANTFDLELTEGRNFDRNMRSDSTAILVNEAAIRHFSSMDPTWRDQGIGKYLTYGEGIQGKVIGILKDFHFETLRENINPLVVQLGLENAFSIQIKLRSKNLSQQISFIENQWKELFPDIPFDYSFLDQRLARHFKSDKKLGELLQIVTILSICIAGLGLFGLATFTVYQRSREMSIRKVIGATEGQLVSLLAWDFIKLILISNCLAIPIGYMYMSEWLDGFAYRTSFPPVVLILAMFFSLLIAAIAVGRQAYATAVQNPVNVLSQN